MRSSLAEAEVQWAELSRLLALRVGIAVPDWVRRSVERGVANAIEACAGRWSLPDDAETALARQAEAAGWRAAGAVGRELGAQLGADLEWQPPIPTSLLYLLQRAVHYPAEVLRSASVPHARRDRVAMKQFPFDIYGLAPRSLAELHPLLPELAQACEEARLSVLAQRFAAAVGSRERTLSKATEVTGPCGISAPQDESERPSHHGRSVTFEREGSDGRPSPARGA